NSFWKLRAGDPGLKPESVLTMNINLPRQQYSRPEQVIEFHRRLIEQVSAVPGVESVGTVTALPYGGATNGFGYTLGSAGCGDKAVSLVSQQTSADFFKAIGIPLIAGREFNDRDIDGSAPVIIARDSLAEKYGPDQHPLSP